MARSVPMKMAGRARLSGLFLLLGALLLGAGAQQTILKEVGSEVIMKPKYTGNPSEINWKINGDKLVDMEVNSQDEPLFYRLQDRATIDRNNGVLTIKDLTTEDSGDYKAEALVNNIYQYTDITLTVQASSDDNNNNNNNNDITITDQSTKENIVLYCNCSTPGVAYEWFKQTESVGKGQWYSEPRPKHDVTLTCVASNEVYKKSSSITIRYIPPDAPLHPVVAIIIVVIIILIVLLFVIAVLHPHREEPSVKKIYSGLTCCATPCMVTFFDKIYYVLTCCKAPFMVTFFDKIYYFLTCCKGNATDVERDPRLAQSQQLKLVGSEVTLEPKYRGDPSEIIWKINGDKLVDMELNSQDEPLFYRLQYRATIDRNNGVLTIRDLTTEDSGLYRAEVLVNDSYWNREITLTVRERSPCITVKFQTKDQPKGKVKPHLTIHDVKPEEHDRCNLEVLQSDGKKDEIGIKETDGVVTIKTEDDRVTLTVLDTEKVAKLTWKKGGVTLFQWAVSGLKLHTSNITLKPGSVTVNNAEGERSYKVEVHSTDNHITNNIMQLEANNQGNESPTNQEEDLEEAETALLTKKANNQGNESPTNQEEDLEEAETALLTKKDLPEPIGSVTFHPNIIANNNITLKKDGEPLNIDNDRLTLSLYGDLTINNVTSGDGGKYTVQWKDQKLEQEFTLGL